MRQAWLTRDFWGMGRTPEAPEYPASHSKRVFGELRASTLSSPCTIEHLERSSRTSRHLKFEVFLSQRGFKFIPLPLWSCQAPAGGGAWEGKGRQGGSTSCQAQARARRCLQAAGQWEMPKATPEIRGDLNSSLFFLYCFSFNTYVMLNTETVLRPGTRAHVSASSCMSQRLKRAPLGQSMLADHTDYRLNYRVQIQMLDLFFRWSLNNYQWLKK